jgi:hypothetical protein
MLEMIKGELTVKQLIRVLKGIKNPDEVYVATENVQDGTNRHNGIVGFERDDTDEYLILKIFNEAKQEKDNLAEAVVQHFDSLPMLNESEESLLNSAVLQLDLE